VYSNFVDHDQHVLKPNRQLSFYSYTTYRPLAGTRGKERGRNRKKKTKGGQPEEKGGEG